MSHRPDPRHLSSDEKDALINALLDQLERLQAEVAILREETADLKRRLGLNSGNSGKPPASDGLKKPVRICNQREKSGKPSGGQAGHEGSTLRPVETPDHVQHHYPETCGGCGEAMASDPSTPYQTRQVFDLPTPVIAVTEHRAHLCRCPHCGQQTLAAFPAGITAPAQYGATIAAWVVYFQYWHFIPEDRLAELMRDVFGLDLATATIAAMGQRKAAEFQALATVIGEQVKQAPVKHLDETGYRITGALHWLHVASTWLLTFYRTSPKRGAMWEAVIGIIVHDFWRPYFTMAGVTHALCNAHHLRELKALIEIENETWALAMWRFLRQACHAANLARDRGIGLKPSFLAWLLARYDRIVAQGVAFHESLLPLASTRQDGDLPPRKRRGRPRRRIGHNLVLRLRDHKDDVLRFLTQPDVPFTNNQAERDIRMMKLRQKISGCFRTETGAQTFVILRSILSTARKQGWNILHTLTTPPDVLLQKLRTA